jgi:hypothetical protein
MPYATLKAFEDVKLTTGDLISFDGDKTFTIKTNTPSAVNVDLTKDNFFDIFDTNLYSGDFLEVQFQFAIADNPMLNVISISENGGHPFFLSVSNYGTHTNLNVEYHTFIVNNITYTIGNTNKTNYTLNIVQLND